MRTSGRAKLHNHVGYGTVNEVRAFLDIDPSAVSWRYRGWTPLHIAALHDQGEIITLLIEHNADIDARIEDEESERLQYQSTPLIVAVERGHHSAVHRLLRAQPRKPDLNIVDHVLGNTALHHGAMTEDSRILHLLLLEGADPNILNAKNKSPLNIAVEKGNRANAVILIGFGGKLSPSDYEEEDPIKHAVGSGRRNDPSTMTPILQKRFAASGFQKEFPSKVLQRSIPDFVTATGDVNLVAGLAWAVKKKDYFILHYLLAISPKLIKKPDQNNWHPLHHAVAQRNLRMVRTLLEQKADVNCITGRSKSTPLHMAAGRGDKDMVDLLLDYNADANAKTGCTADGEMTPAQLASRESHHSIYQKLKDITKEDISPGDDKSTTGTEVSIDTTHSMAPRRGGKFDGSLMEVALQQHQRRTFAELSQTYDNYLDFFSRDRKVKVAVLDTGIDDHHSAFQQSRIIYSVDGTKEHAPNANRLIDRIKLRRNFATGLKYRDQDVHDLDGHGTAVAGILLTVAPNCELLIARVCDGNPKDQSREEKRKYPGNPQRKAKALSVAQAIEWAISEKVDIINLSIGFEGVSDDIKSLKPALQHAREAGVLVFAAMVNDGNYSSPCYPACNDSLAIGIHGCKSGGGVACSYAANAIEGKANFMAAGEKIIVHSRKSEYRIAEGCSFATPIAAGMAALILAFVNQTRKDSKMEMERIASTKSIDKLWDIKYMILLLKKISVKSRDGLYHWIHPKLLWKEFDDKCTKERWAWDLLANVLPSAR